MNLKPTNYLHSWSIHRSRALACLAALAFSFAANAKTFVIPHVLEKSGTINATTFTFDTTLFMTYTPSINGKDRDSAQIEFYLYDESGVPMTGISGAAVCAPCTYQMSAAAKKLSIRIDDLIVTKGGGFDTAVKLGFGVIVVSGSGADAVNLQGFVVNSHTSPFDASLYGSAPEVMPQTRPPAGTPSQKKTFSFPHVLETSGRAMSGTPNSIDSVIYATYTGGLPGVPAGTGATVEFYLYDQQTGQPMVGGGGGVVCNPCTFNLGTGGSTGAARKQTINIDDMVTAAGGFGGAAGKLGFGVVVISGGDPDGVNLQGFVVNSHTGPFDLSVFSFEPSEIKTNPPASPRSTYVVPHILEKSGLTASSNYTFDTMLLATYNGGIGGLPQGAGASLDFYLYDDSGALMTGLSGTAICGPCTFNLGTGAAGTPAPRKQSIRVDDLITSNGGGFDATVKLGFGILVVGGSNPENVNLQGFVVNSHSGPFDLSVFGFDPQPLDAAARLAPPPGGPTNGLSPRAFVIPHVLETSGKITDSPNVYDTEMYMTYVGGLPGSISSNGAAASLYLFDSATGQILKGGGGTDVCNPCMYNLTAAARKASIRIDDLIVANGGGFGAQPNRSAMGVVVLDGDTTNVVMQGFVVNAHTSAFDLSVFGFEPQPIQAARMVPMPVTVGQNGGFFEISVPTVLGGHYEIQGQNNLNDAWSSVQTFDGDGTVQVKKLPASPATQQFWRVKGS